MSLSDISTTISLDLYDHDLTPSKIKAIALDSKTRYVNAQLTKGGQQYDIGQSTAVTLTIIRPDKTGVQVTGATYSYLVYIDGTETTMYGARAELTQTALAVSGTLQAQFMLKSGEQILRSEIFTINNGVALDSTVSEWAGEYQGYNLDELVQNVNESSAKVNAMEADVSELKSGLSDLQDGGYVADAQKIQEKIDNYLDEHPEATTTVEDESITKSKLSSDIRGDIDHVESSMDKASGQPLSAGAINAILCCANTYIDKNSVLSYGHDTATHRTDSSVSPSESQEIDCSTFVELVVNGVPYEQSKYVGLSENKLGSLGYCFDLYDNSADRADVMPKYSLSYSMAKRLHDIGYGFYPTNDLTNLCAGDILFFSTQPHEDNRFLGIDHVAILVDRQISGEDDVFTTIDVRDNREAVCQVAYAFNTTSGSLMKKLVYAARIPLQGTGRSNSVFMLSPNTNNTANQPFTQEAYKCVTVRFDGIINTSGNHFTLYINDVAHLVTDNVTGDMVGVKKQYTLVLALPSAMTTLRVASSDNSAKITNVKIENGYASDFERMVTKGINVSLTTDEYGTIDFNKVKNAISAVTSWEQVVSLSANGYILNRESSGAWRVFTLSGNTPNITRVFSQTLTVFVIYTLRR